MPTGKRAAGRARAERGRSWTRWRLALAALAVATSLAAVPRARATEELSLDDVDWLHPRIVNGSLTFEYPSAAALLAGGNPATATVICSGTLIGCRTFLTAAHCVCEGNGADCQAPNAPDPSSLLVFTQNAGFLAVNEVIVHPSYDFPIADFAVLKLGPVADGIRPSPLNTQTPAIPMDGTIAGFGRSGGGSFNDDFGIKRVGSVETTNCASGDDVDLVCWDFLGPGSNTCSGDSGGPLYMDFGSGDVLAGVTSGGASPTCLPNDHSFDGNVATYSAWIADQGGADVTNTACGTGAQVGDSDVDVLGVSGYLDATNATATHDLLIASGTGELRVAMNGHDDGTANFDFYVKHGAPPTPSDFDCAQTGIGQFGYCDFPAPPGGEWYVRVDRQAGAGQYQIATTNLGTRPSTCGNSVREPGEDCDGADANQCAGLCQVDCQCPAPMCGNGVKEAGEECDGGDDAACPGACGIGCTCPCIVGFLDVRRLKANERHLLLKAELDNTTGEFDGLDPRDEFTMLLDDGTTQIYVSIPTLDEGWVRSRPEKGRYKWKGLIDGIKRITIKDKTAKKGVWQLNVRGKEVPGADAIISAPVTVEIGIDGECSGEDIPAP
jgi:hypothetical protein